MPILSRNSPVFKQFARFLREGLDLLFPPRCLVCRALEEIEPDGMVCRDCFSSLFLPDSILSSFEIRTAGEYAGPLRELIHRAKFSADPLPLSTLVLLLERTVLDWPESPDVITSVPPSPKRLRERGIDLPGTLAKRLSGRIHLPYERNLLRRTRETAPQTSLKREERLGNLSGVFAIGKDPGDRRILVVDDVVTTGATASAILETFSQDPRPNVRFLAVARTPENLR